MSTLSLDIHRAVRDFEYYSANLLQIRTKDCQIVPFRKWYPSQALIWKSIKRDIVSDRPVRKIILKPRQCGASTLTEAVYFWQVATRANTRGLVLSMDIGSTQTIFEMARGFYECLPASLRPMKRYSSRKELAFENPDEKTRLQNPGLRSRIEVQTAGKYVPPRGGNFSHVHFSEVAFWPYGAADDIVPAIVPMVPDLPGTMIVYESTANGVDNFFHNEWRAARRGESAFDPIFFPWIIMPEYSMPFYDTEERQELLDTVDDDERALLELGTTYEQLNWRRFKITALKGDVDLFKQEYPSTEDEAFIYSGDPVFSRNVLKRIVTREPAWVGNIDLYQDTLHQDDDGLLNIYEHPTMTGDYVIGVDVSSGAASDYSCMCVLKRTWPDGLAEQVAEWHGKVDPVALGKLAVVLAKHYNNAMLSIEINNHGLTTQSEAQRHYWNFYRWQYFDRVGRTYTNKIGWDTNISTKPILVDRARACLRDGLVGISSERLLQEMKLYVKHPDSVSMGAESGNDDAVMAFLIALCTLYIEDPDASFVSGAEKPVLAHDAAHNTRAVGVSTEVHIPPVWDNTDPRGSLHTKRNLNWQCL